MTVIRCSPTLTGAERKNAVIAEENRRLVAYHEAGHAVVALWTPGMYVLFAVPLVCVMCHGMHHRSNEGVQGHYSTKR